MTSNLSTPGSASDDGRGLMRFGFLNVLPVLILLTLAVWPLINGSRTLFFRDVLNTHLEMKWFQAEAMRDGYLPLVDPYRAGGQTHLGNPNTVALHPDNLLYLVADPIWAMNAHFWLHLMLAPFAFFWLGRAWGLRREAAWTGGVVFAVSGYILSCFNLYNLIAPAVWAPALAACFLTLAVSRTVAMWLATSAGVWALLIVAGDPITAVFALVLATSAVLARDGIAWRTWGRLAAAVGLGTMLAAPMVLEFLRLLSLSYRGHFGYSSLAATAGSWHPARVLDWFLPLAFGSPDLAFWGHRFHAGFPPLLFSLSPGVLTLALVGIGVGVRGRAVRWAGWSAVAGLFFALGRSNPLVGGLLSLPGAGGLRMPVKFWLLVAVGSSLLAAIGVDNLLSRGQMRPLTRSLGWLAGVFLSIWVVLLVFSARIETLIRGWMPPALPAELAASERLRWTGVALLSVLLCLMLIAVVQLARRRVDIGIPILLIIHVLAQLFFLRPLLETDDVAPYRQPSPAEQLIPKGARAVHGTDGKLFETGTIPIRSYPDASSRWLHRSMFHDFHPAAGMMAGRFYDFTLSPEGLDSFLTRATVQAIERLDDVERMRILASSGVEWLLLRRELEPPLVESGMVELAGSFASGEDQMHIYRLLQRAEEAQFVGTLYSSDNLNEALARMLSPDFDPRSDAVLAGDVGAGSGTGGRVTVKKSEAERMIWEVEAEGSGALLVQRSHLPLYRAVVDGRRTPIYVANMHRMAVLLEPGRHTVELFVDRTRFRLGVGLALGSLAMMSGVAWWE
ncbi:MAG: hypothetical protein OEM62_06220, partial [Acidobacteriota bacterium]|nr:hypothetical protein [Acidobacteriota bacterium]